MKGGTRGAGCGVLLILLSGVPARAQVQASAVADTAASRVPQAASRSADTTIRRPTTPMGAMFRSFLIPGWGQAVYGRKVTAGVMLGVEGLALGMLLKVSSERQEVVQTDTVRINAKKQEKQDWITIVVFNHLMSGLEAYVSSHLYDFPGDLQMQALPTGGMGVGVTLPIGRR